MFRGEIHAAPVHDVHHAPEPLTAPMMRMLGAQSPAAQDFIDSALGRLHDRGLTGEVSRFRRFDSISTGSEKEFGQQNNASKIC